MRCVYCPQKNEPPTINQPSKLLTDSGGRAYRHCGYASIGDTLYIAIMHTYKDRDVDMFNRSLKAI